MWSREGIYLTLVILSLTCEYPDISVLVSRRRSYCTGHSICMGLSEFSVRDGPEREHLGDGSVGATGISKFRCSGPSG